MADDEYEELNGGLVCLVLVLVTAVGAIAGGTVVLTVATFVDDGPEPIEVYVGGPLVAEGNGYERIYGDQIYPMDDGNYDERVWTIALNYYDAAYNYLNEDSGQIIGFSIDVIEQVCYIANKNCQLVRDRYSNAWSNGLGGHGLMAGWYDGALGWFITYPRLRTYHFAEPFTKKEPAFFAVANGNPTGFDWRDLTGKTIAFLEFLYVDPSCLVRHGDEINGVPLTDANIVFLGTSQQIIDAVASGEVDAAFVSRDYTDIGRSLEQNGPYLDRCSIGGVSVMTRKDSHLESWWNPAWKTLLNSPKYEELCDRIDNVYNIFGQSSAEMCVTR